MGFLLVAQLRPRAWGRAAGWRGGAWKERAAELRLLGSRAFETGPISDWGAKVIGMKGEKKLPEPALHSLQSRGARAGDARAQPPALLSVGCDSASRPTRDPGDDKGKAEGGPDGPDGTRDQSGGSSAALYPHQLQAGNSSPYLPPAVPLPAGCATLHPVCPLRAAAGVPARKSVAKRGVPKGAETFLQIGAAQRGQRERSLATGFLPAGANVSDSRRRGGGQG